MLLPRLYHTTHHIIMKTKFKTGSTLPKSHTFCNQPKTPLQRAQAKIWEYLRHHGLDHSQESYQRAFKALSINPAQLV